jgi:hypothetical protein
MRRAVAEQKLSASPSNVDVSARADALTVTPVYYAHGITLDAALEALSVALNALK